MWRPGSRRLPSSLPAFVCLLVTILAIFRLLGLLSGAPAGLRVPSARLPPRTPLLKGLLNKTAQLDNSLFHHMYLPECQAAQAAWVERAALAAHPPPDPPGCATCPVFGNEQYKVLFIRQTKTGSTAVLKFFQQFGAQLRLSPLYNAKVTGVAVAGETAEEAARTWRDFFVFTVARNPYERAVSSYSYLMQLVHGKQAQKLDWDTFCRNPYAISHFAARHPDSSNVDARFHLIHIADQAHCMVDPVTGGMTLDFVASVDNLETDLAAVVAHINARRDEGVPELKLQTLAQEDNQSKVRRKCDDNPSQLLGAHEEAADATHMGPGLLIKEQYCSTHEYFSGRHAHCRDSITEHYRQDLELLYGPDWEEGLAGGS